MSITNQLCLMLSFYFLHQATHSSPQREDVDEEAPHQTFDLEEADPPPPSNLQATPRLDPRFTSTSTSTFTMDHRASIRLSTNVGSAMARAQGNLFVPWADCPIPNAASPPRSLQQAEPPSGSDTDVGEELRLQVSRAASEGPDCQLFHHSNIQAARLRFHWSPGRASSDDPLLLSHTIDVEFPAADRSQRSVKPPVYLGETFLSLTYQAVVALVVFHFQSTSNDNKKSSTAEPPSGLLLAAEVAVVVGFAASLIGILLREACLKVATAIERAGSVSAAAGFFLMMGMLLTSISQWMGWLCGGASLVAFGVPFVKMRREGKF